MKPKVTMHEIAKLSNSSISTVSRVFNGSGYPVNKETRQRILETANEAGYSYKGQSNQRLEDELSDTENNIIGVIVPNLTNQHYTVLLQGIEDLATRNEFSILLCNANRDSQKETNFIKLLENKRIKGIIIAAMNSNIKHLKEYRAKGNHVISIEEKLDIECDTINYNFLQSGFLAAEYLYDLGHRKIGFLSSPVTRKSREDLQKGFVSCLRGKGVAEESIRLYISDTLEEEKIDDSYEHINGQVLVKRMTADENIPTAIFCVNDMTALGAIHQLNKEGLRVPGDISVMGFDNIPFGRTLTPELTTIDQNSFELGAIACDTLIKKMNGDLNSYLSLSFEPTLIERKSTKRLSVK